MEKLGALQYFVSTVSIHSRVCSLGFCTKIPEQRFVSLFF